MKNKNASYVVWLLVLGLLILHQDFWWWDDRTLVFGFMPIGLFYHAMFSIAAAAVWFLAVKFAWPVRAEQWADEAVEDESDVPATPSKTVKEPGT